jgi:hypothetical protein
MMAEALAPRKRVAAVQFLYSSQPRRSGARISWRGVPGFAGRRQEGNMRLQPEPNLAP